MAPRNRVTEEDRPGLAAWHPPPVRLAGRGDHHAHLDAVLKTLVISYFHTPSAPYSDEGGLDIFHTITDGNSFDI